MKRRLTTWVRCAIGAVAATTVSVVVVWGVLLEPDDNAFFPDHAFDERQTAYLSGIYTGMREPSLYASKGEDGTSYRLVRLPSLMAPVSIRIDADDEGKAVLTYAIGSFIRNGSTRLTLRGQHDLDAGELERLVMLFSKSSLCDLPVQDPTDAMYIDGEAWIVEYRSDSEYCAVVRMLRPAGQLGIFTDYLHELTGDL